MKSFAVGIALLTLALPGCADRSSPGAGPTTAAKAIENSALDGLLLRDTEIDSVMGTAMVPFDSANAMQDNRNLLPNLNCLGVWQVNEAAIYGERGPGSWQAVRRRMLRSPDSDEWESVAVQSAVSYASAEAAQEFFAASTDRWSECTGHRVNITLNDKPLPKWLSGELDTTPTRLTMPILRGTDAETRSCQRVLAISLNVIIDTLACKAQSSPVSQAADITSMIEANGADAAVGG